MPLRGRGGSGEDALAFGVVGSRQIGLRGVPFSVVLDCSRRLAILPNGSITQIKRGDESPLAAYMQALCPAKRSKAKRQRLD